MAITSIQTASWTRESAVGFVPRLTDGYNLYVTEDDDAAAANEALKRNRTDKITKLRQEIWQIEARLHGRTKGKSILAARQRQNLSRRLTKAAVRLARVHLDAPSPGKLDWARAAEYFELASRTAKDVGDLKRSRL